MNRTLEHSEPAAIYSVYQHASNDSKLTSLTGMACEAVKTTTLSNTGVTGTSPRALGIRMSSVDGSCFVCPGYAIRTYTYKIQTRISSGNRVMSSVRVITIDKKRQLDTYVENNLVP